MLLALATRDAPKRYGPPKTLYNRVIRSSKAGVYNRTFAGLVFGSHAADTAMIDATRLKAHRTMESLLKMGAVPRRTGRTKGRLN